MYRYSARHSTVYMCECGAEEHYMILFHYALGAKSQFHLVYVLVFFPLSASLFNNIYRWQKKSVSNEIILQHIHIKYKWCEYFNETQFIVTGSMSQLICTKCELRPGFTSSVKGDTHKKTEWINEESERASFGALECVKGRAKSFPRCSENHIRLDFPHFDSFAVLSAPAGS